MMLGIFGIRRGHSSVQDLLYPTPCQKGFTIYPWQKKNFDSSCVKMKSDTPAMANTFLMKRALAVLLPNLEKEVLKDW